MGRRAAAADCERCAHGNVCAYRDGATATCNQYDEDDPDRTCRMRLASGGVLYDVWECSSCGARFAESLTDAGAWGFDPDYCPCCGRRVVA